MLQRAEDIDWDWLKGAKTVGVTAGASAPEILVREVLDTLRDRFNVKIEDVTTSEENVTFKLPAALLQKAV